MNFKTYLNTYLKEKGISEDESITIIDDGGIKHFLNIGVIIEFMNGLGKDTQKAIKKKLIQIDFFNGDVRKFLEYVGAGMIKL